ncbi:MAG: hypothetical protein KF749_11065 [Bacteroidetes bacterium]|nr:hypothetical protein [Bacteroidota bacterium]MCW5896067.1 hypothetical protein [Bacteroidota bacterium]
MSYLVHHRILRSLLATLFLIYTVQITTVAQEEDGPVSNIRPEKQGRVNVFLEYDLAGSPSDVYTVTLTIRLHSDTSYSYTPINVIGDIGANIRPGKNKRISWRISDEYVSAYDDVNDIRFVISAIPAESEGGNSGLYIAGGAVVAGLTLAIILLSSKKDDDAGKTNVFPQPPGRP